MDLKLRLSLLWTLFGTRWD